MFIVLISYWSEAKKLSIIQKDQEIPVNKKVVHWVEHVVRSGGAEHLK